MLALNSMVEQLTPSLAANSGFRAAHSVRFVKAEAGVRLLVCDGLGKLCLRDAEGACAQLGQVDLGESTAQACLVVSPSGHHFACATGENHVKVGP